jgi:hypothetical protein
LLNPNGIASFEFPHIMQLVENNQFDTIYHEHYSYLSLLAVEKIFLTNGLRIFDAEEIPTHGGSLRIYAQRLDTGMKKETSRLVSLRNKERGAGIAAVDFYLGFQSKANRVKSDLLSFLLDAQRKDHKVIAYGAAAKGNTLLNYAGVRPDLVTYVVDRNPAKQGKYLPGSRIPIVSEERLSRDRPEIVLILPWNIKEEVTMQLSYIREWGGRFCCAIPNLRYW